jgi:hypothetical protein
MRQGRFTPVLLGFELLFSWAFFPSPAWAGIIRDDRPDANYLALANTPAYAPVGTLVNSWGYNGSATLIAPDWLLTAAHNLIAANSATFTLNGVAYTSSQLFLNPNWQSSNPMSPYDVGLVHLATPVLGVSPARLYTDSTEIGQIGTFVGWGLTGTGLTGYLRLDNQRRAFQNVIDGDFGNPSLLLGADFDNPHNPADTSFGDFNPLDLEGAVAPGDSGGGVFITVDSQTYLAGVISFIAATDGNPNADYGDVSGFGRVSGFHPWIVSTIPEPSSIALLAVAVLALFWRKCRSAESSRHRSK